MLKHRSGNLLKDASEPRIVMHGCNAQGVMGSGFALQIRKQFPEAYRVYLAADRRMCSVSYTIIGDTTVANCITQLLYGTKRHIRYVDYMAVRSCCKSVAYCHTLCGRPIHLPFIGGGRGNGDRATLMAIFEEEFSAGNLDVTLWELE